jgi:heat shock protein HslJ
MRVILVAALSLLTACASDKCVPIADADWLMGTWSITEIDGVTMQAQSEAEPGPGFIFNPGIVGGYSACNSFSGGYSFDEGKLTITDFISTEEGCGESEGVLYAILQSAPELTRTGDDTFVLMGNGDRIVRAARIGPPNATSQGDAPCPAAP